MISVHAKCEVSRGKVVIIEIKVSIHDFSKALVIPDTILVHSIPEEDHKGDGEDKECNKYSVGKWYSGKMFYSVKDMAIEDFYEPEIILPHLYFYTESGGDRKKQIQSSEKSNIYFTAS